jgi:hypothetical protein
MAARKLKRKLPPEAYPDKICLWCGAVLIRTRQSFSEWERVSTCGSTCASNWKWHQCSKDELIERPPSNCEYCDAILIQREDETRTAWMKRITCNKSCAASLKRSTLYVKPVFNPSNAERVGCITYKPDSPEFAELAKHYLNRDHKENCCATLQKNTIR